MIETNYLGLGALRSLTVCILSSCESLSQFSCTAGGSFSDDGYSRMLLRAILLFYSLRKTVVFGFLQGPSIFSLRILATRAVSDMDSISWTGSGFISLLFTPNCSFHILGKLSVINFSQYHTAI